MTESSCPWQEPFCRLTAVVLGHSPQKMSCWAVNTCAESAENALIMESVKNQTDTDDKDLSPDGLVYNVTNLELDVERCAIGACISLNPIRLPLRAWT